MEFTLERHLRCAPEHAFDLMADARNETKWNSQVSRSELRSEEPVGPGSQFLIVNRGQEYDATLATYERPSRLGFQIHGQMEMAIAYSFAPDEDGTRYRAVYDFRPTGATKLLAALLTPVIRRSLNKETDSFKALCER